MTNSDYCNVWFHYEHFVIVTPFCVIHEMGL